MRLKRPSLPFTPPNMCSFLKEKHWVISEAVHALVGWPKENLFTAPLSLSPEGITPQRSFHLPCLDSPFDSSVFGERFHDVFLEMKKSIEKGELRATFGYFNDVVTYLLSPEEVILWALDKGFVISQDLQRASNVYQFGDQKTTDSIKTKVQRKLVAQFILARTPSLNMTDMLKDDLMKRLGSLDKTADKEFKVIKRAINELYTTPGIAGRPTNSPENKKKRVYLPIPIPEVMHRDSDGIVYYHFPNLRSGIDALARAVIGDHPSSEMSIEELFLEFLKDSVVKLYLPDPSELIVKFIRNIHFSVLADFLPFIPLIEAIEHLYAIGGQIESPLRHEKFELKLSNGLISLF